MRTVSAGPRPRKRIHRSQGVVEESAVVVNARQPRTRLEVVAEDVLPPLVDERHFAEEAMATNVETIAAVLYRSGDPSDHVVLLQHDGIGTHLGQFISGGQSRWSCPNDYALPPLPVVHSSHGHPVKRKP